jgi:hypothetical protein
MTDAGTQHLQGIRDVAGSGVNPTLAIVLKSM